MGASARLRLDLPHVPVMRNLLHNVRVNAPSNHGWTDRRLNQGVDRERLRSAESSAALSASWCIA